jgi:hypothetical protein
MQAVDSTAQRAFAINLDDSVYGNFAEIGAGQEVARWFFAVGAPRARSQSRFRLTT